VQFRGLRQNLSLLQGIGLHLSALSWATQTLLTEDGVAWRAAEDGWDDEEGVWIEEYGAYDDW
jgi:hypothetical protein